MYAVIETGGKQYRVEVGTELEVELLEANPGESVNVERVLLVADGDTAAIGRPVVANASVAAEIVRRDVGEKTISFKYRPKARRRVKKGHRQALTILRISDIVFGGKSAAAEKAEADAARQAEREKLEETARKQAAADAALAKKLESDRKAEQADAKAEKATSKSSSKATSTRGSASKSGASKAAGSKASASKSTTSKATSSKASTSKADKSTDKKPSRARTKKDG